MDTPPRPLHFILIPHMAQGHLIPTADFGRCLAERGNHVTIVTTPINAARLRPSADRVQSSGVSFSIFTLRFPCEAVGLPEGYENADLVPDAEMLLKFFAATDMLEEPLREYVGSQVALGPTCIISDFSLPWTRHVSREFKIPRYVFYSICCFTLFCDEVLTKHYENEGIGDDDESVVVVPELEQKIEVTRLQAPGFFSSYPNMGAQVEEAESTANGIIVNTVAEMEPLYVDKYAKAKNKKIWTVGPVSLINKDISDKARRGSNSTIDTTKLLKWLDTMNPNSVIYVNFGSLARTPPQQVVEIGMGLESSNHPFVWVIQSREKMAEVEEWLIKSGFEERNKAKSIIIRGWAPQVMILSHPSIGGFVTHCGWNSTMEGITAGVPMITWPCFNEQFLNERFVVDVLEIGVPVGVKAPVWWWEEVVKVDRETMATVLRNLMDSGEEEERRRWRALEVSEKAKSAMEVGGSSHGNITSFIVEVRRLLCVEDIGCNPTTGSCGSVMAPI